MQESCQVSLPVRERDICHVKICVYPLLDMVRVVLYRSVYVCVSLVLIPIVSGGYSCCCPVDVGMLLNHGVILSLCGYCAVIGVGCCFVLLCFFPAGDISFRAYL